MDHAEAREVLEVAAVEPGGLARLMAGDTPEAAALAGHLAGCAECTDELDRLRRVAGIVRGVVRTTPPPDLRERTLALVRAVGRDRSRPGTVAGSFGAGSATAGAGAATAATAPRHAAVPVGAARSRPVPWQRLAAMAAILAIALAGTGLLISQNRGIAERDATIGRQAEAVTDLATVTAWALRVSGQPDARRVNLASASAPGERGTLLFSPGTRELVVVATGLSQPPAGHEFRCWLDTGGTRQSVGKMFFGGGLAYWVGPVEAVAGLTGKARFGVSLVDLATPGAVGEPVLVGEL